MRLTARTTLLVTVLAGLLGNFAAAQAIPPPYRLTIQSEVLHEARLILVRLPADYLASGKRYPVLYMTDGSSGMAHAISSIEFLVRNGRMPDVIVVGIENTDRTRDLTPTRVAAGSAGAGFDVSTTGGADNFLKFIETELVPTIEKQYRTVPYRVFAGHSFGGLFAVHALMRRPDLFGAYVAASPSLQWDNQTEVKQAEEFLRGRKELNKTLFLTIANEGGGMQEALNRFEGLLRAKRPRGLEWSAMPMPDEDHGSSVLRAYYFGLRKVFSDWQLPSDPNTGTVAGGVKAADEHYRKLSGKYGYTIATPESVINRIGYVAIQNGQFADAVEAFKVNVERYPQSANVYDSLAEGYALTKEYDLARQNSQIAVRLGTESKDPNLAAFRERLEKLSAGAARPAK